jgi:signal transduction histidine kinase
MQDNRAMPVKTRTAGGPPRSALGALGIAGLLAGAGVGALLLTSEQTDGGVAFVVLALVIAWAFIGTGLRAWRRRPESRIGALMVGVGFAWLANGLLLVDVPGVFIVGALLSNVWIVLLFLLLLTFPSGRLRGGYERLLAIAAWLSGVVLQLPPLLFLATPDPDRCEKCPANPILIADDPTASSILFGLQVAVAVPTMVGLLILLVKRWRGATPAQRGAFTPVLWAGGLVLALTSLQLLTQVSQISNDIPNALFVLVLPFFAAVPFAFMVGLLRTHLSREAAVSGLLERLRELPVHGGALQELLGDALGDPSLELAYWLPAESRYVDSSGQPLDVTASGSRRFVSEVAREGRPIGALICDPALADQRQLVDAVGAAATLALENERLEAELRARVEELHSSRARIVAAGFEERRQVERDLHDGAQQRLMALNMSLRLARSKVDTDPALAAELLDGAMQELSEATSELRELARGIHPAVLSDRGLAAALGGLAGRSPVPVEIVETPAERLPAPVESTTYFVIAEALTNVARYSQAGNATVRVARENGMVEVEVSDDGVGGANPAAGTGLRGLGDRVAALDGEFKVSSPAGEGTTVRASIPCA